MTAAAVLGLLAGIGCIGAVYGARATRPSLESIARSGSRTLQLVPEPPHRGVLTKAASRWTESASIRALFRHPRWIGLTPSLTITGTAPTQLASRILAGAGLGLLAPPLLWAGAETAGISMSVLLPVLLALVLIPAGARLPLLILKGEATERRQHFRTVIGTYVDLVVLNLAGGAGIEESLLSASTVSTDWAAKRISKALLLARDTGEPAWEALSGLGQELDVPELVELSATLQLAGTEGARVRQSLSARAASLRRHEQAEAESAANAMTERLFLPGTLLLLGFLLFIGYPAFHRILSGF